MSTQHKGAYSAEEIEELRSRYSNEKVAALVAEAKAVAEAEEEDVLGTNDAEGDAGEGSESEGGENGGEPAVDPYKDLKVDQLTSLLKDRGLATDGLKAELHQRLLDDDAAKASSGE